MSYMLPFKPGEKVIELGGGASPLLRPNADFRKLPTVDIVCDFERRFPIENESYDGVFAKFVIEHISWRRVPHFVGEVYRILKPGGLAVLIAPNTFEQCREIIRRNRIGIEESALLFGGQEGSWEETGNYHKAAFSFDYVQKLFKEAGFTEVVTKPLPTCHTDLVIEARKGVPQDLATRIKQSKWYTDLKEDLIGKPKKNLRLNVGSFTVMIPGFINIDILDLSNYAKEHGFLFEQVDVRYGLPYPDGSVDFINVSHLIEHLSRKEAKYFLKECRRVLNPKGKIRIGTPDLNKLIEVYLERDMDRFNEHQPEEYRKASSQAEKFWRILTPGHKTIYDYEALSRLLEETGFKAKKARYNKKYDMYPDHTIYVTAKPLRVVSPHKGKLKIALVSTPFLRTRPDTYGGLEAVVADLAEALAEMGHEVTVFAADGSKGRVKGCKVIEFGPPALKVQVNWLEAEKKAYEVYKDLLGEFSIVHDHNWFAFPYLAKMKTPGLKICHTHHGGLSWKSKPPGVEKANLVAISKWMKKVYESQGWNSRYVYNGINLDAYPFKAERGDRLVFVGRIDKFKQPHVAIEVAKKVGAGLDIVGGTFVQKPAYLEKIKDMCDGEQIRFYPDAPHEVKLRLLQDAKALLFPSKMGEPFGLVACEMMATGGPVIASRDGAIPEVVEHGRTGFVCDTVDEMVEAVKEVHGIKPEHCRRHVKDKFSKEVMAKNYLKLYLNVLNGKEW